MIKIYHASTLKKLIRKNCNIINNNPIKNPFINETFLIYNHPIQSYWIKFYIAKKINICANNNFYKLEKFIFTLFEKIIPDFNKNFLLNSNNIFYKLMMKNKKKNFLIHKRETLLKKYFFYEKISKLLKKYFIFHHEWIQYWMQGNLIPEINKKYIWQQNLWIDILFQKQQDKKKIKYKNFFEIFYENIKIKKDILPNRIFVYGIDNLPKFYFKIFNILSKFCKIFFFNINFFLDTKKNENILIKKNSIIKNNSFLFVNINNYIFFLKKKKKIFKIKNLDNKKNYKPKNLLEFIQKKITEKKINKKIKKINFILKKSDDSISINVFHTIQNEIEFLQQFIIKTLNKNKKYFPKDILIICENINKYIPYINSVFKKKTKKYDIPFTIYHSEKKLNNSIVQFFLKILSLNKNKFKINEIFKLFQFLFLKKDFICSTNEISILFKWIKKSEIKFGLDEKHLCELNYKKYNFKNTWEHGIKRILLSIALKKSNNNSWDNINPLDYFLDFSINLFNKLIKFINTLKKWKKKILINKTSKSWSSICELILQDFFNIKNKKIKKTLNLIQKKWNFTIYFCQNVFNNKKIPIEIIKNKFIQNIKKNKFSKKILIESIIFSNGKYFEDIPFKVIAFIGCNKNNFIQKKISNNFDLVEKYKKNNFVLQKTDNYILINKILSAKKYFYISCINENMKKNNFFKSNKIILKLLEYIKKTTNINNKKNNDIVTINNVISNICTFHKQIKIFIKK
ncbi:exodeoxyribonuclease V subunit gamma [Buchnera aphidicola (Kurisakia onigurumii)]|uniref:exodeoxyribonuclease V subunit gamma n=1 Tax=Buchnera aphidicola TaxID=9 RepID=UPI0031B6D491